MSIIKRLARKTLRWTNPSFVRNAWQLSRIASLPRFQKGTTSILGKEFTFSDGASFVQLYHEIFEQQLYHFQTTSDRPVIVDCGANIGLSIIYYKKLFPKAQIIAFEPDPDLFIMLKGNLKSFGITDVALHQKAVMNVATTLGFKKQGGSSGHIVEGNNVVADPATIQVESVTLHPFMSSKIEFLKIDIEGAEFPVLQSISNELANVEKLFVEYHSFADRQQQLGELLEIIRSAGFRYFIYPAITSDIPFKDVEERKGMDMQLNIYAIRK